MFFFKTTFLDNFHSYGRQEAAFTLMLLCAEFTWRTEIL